MNTMQTTILWLSIAMIIGATIEQVVKPRTCNHHVIVSDSTSVKPM